MAEKIVRSCRKPKYCRILSETGTKTARILCCRFGPCLRDKPGRRLPCSHEQPTSLLLPHRIADGQNSAEQNRRAGPDDPGALPFHGIKAPAKVNRRDRAPVDGSDGLVSFRGGFFFPGIIPFLQKLLEGTEDHAGPHQEKHADSYEQQAEQKAAGARQDSARFQNAADKQGNGTQDAENDAGDQKEAVGGS